MADERPISPALRDAIAARMKELALSPSDLIELTGRTGPGLAPLHRGEIRKYQVRLTRPVCDALGWTPDSINRILDGKKPQLADRRHRGGPAGSHSPASRLAVLERLADQAVPQLAEVAVDTETNRERIEALESRVAELERRMSRRQRA